MLYRPNEQGALIVDAPESELAGRGERLAAWLIDYALYAAVMVVTLVIAIIAIIAIFAFGIAGAFSIAGDGFESLGDFFSAEFLLALVLIGILLLSTFLALFITQMVLLAKRGQTIGKILMKIRVVDATTGEHPGWVRLVLLRTILNSLISSVLSAIPLFVIPLGAIPFVGEVPSFAYFLTDSLFIFRDDRRTIHDLIAGTRVDKVIE